MRWARGAARWWPWKREHTEELAVVDWLDSEVITPDHPLYLVLMTAAREGKPVHAIYDTRTGEVISTEVLE